MASIEAWGPRFRSDILAWARGGTMPGAWSLSVLIAGHVFGGAVGWQTEPRPGERVGPRPRPVMFMHRVDLCSSEVIVKGVHFNFDTRCDDDLILYVQTLDRRFASGEGL